MADENVEDVTTEGELLEEKSGNEEEETTDAPDKEVEEETSTGEEEGETEEEEEEEEQEEGKLSSKAQEKVNRRINKLTKEREHFKKLALAKTKDEGVKPLTTEDETAEFNVPKPAYDNYDTEEEFNEAVVDWKFDKRDHGAKVEKAKEAIADREIEAEANYDAMVEDGLAKYEDFEKIAQAKDVPYSSAMRDLVIESDLAAELCMHFGKNKDVAMDIAQMSSLEAAKAIGRLEERIKKPVKRRTVSQAPDVINPVKGKNEPQGKTGDALSTKEWLAKRDKEVRASLQ